MVLLIIIPMNNGYNWWYTPFPDIPIYDYIWQWAQMSFRAYHTYYIHHHICTIYIIWIHTIYRKTLYSNYSYIELHTPKSYDVNYYIISITHFVHIRSGWWFGTCFIFSIYWEFHHPNSYFSRWWLHHQPGNSISLFSHIFLWFFIIVADIQEADFCHCQQTSRLLKTLTACEVYLLITVQNAFIPQDPKSAYYCLIFYWGNCYCAGIYWATPWNLLGYALEPPIYCTVPFP